MVKWNLNPFEGYRGKHKWLPKNTIFCTVHGSHAYGTSTPESDIDLRGICIPPKEYFMGFATSFEQAESNEPYDFVMYDIRKFFRLASQCNPNIIEFLNTDKEDWVITSPAFEKLWENKHLFLSQKARHTFAGYANSQLKRIKTHRKWLLEPIKEKPSRQEFGLSDDVKMNVSAKGAMEKLINDGAEFDKQVLSLLHREQAYYNAVTHWKQYNSWKKNRNEKRAKLEAEFGFDSKHASHLVRLLTMCKEIVSDGIVQVKRPDADILLDIRAGKWSYEEILVWAEQADKEIEEMLKTSPLPKSPNLEKLNKLCVELVEEFYK